MAGHGGRGGGRGSGGGHGRRPHDWHPLAGGDPVPGDPIAVAEQARHHRDVAREIRDQAASLRRLGRASWDSDAGRVFATKTEEAASKLEQVVERYEVVGSQLTKWATPLEDAQQRSVALLEEAKQAQQRADALATSGAAWPALPAVGATPEQERAAAQAADAERARIRDHQQALDDVAAAKHKLQGVVEERDSHARSAAQAIKTAAEHDGLKDGRFQRFKSWVKDHAKGLRTAANILGWVATGLAVAALFISGAGILLLLGAVLASQLALHSALASSGEGDWLDVGLDIVGLALLVVGGSAMLRAGKGAAGRATTTGARTASRAAAAERRAANAATKRGLQRAGQLRGVRGDAARSSLSQLKAAERAAGRRAAAAVRREVTAQGGRLAQAERLWVGDHELSAVTRQLRLLSARFPQNAEVQAAIAAARRSLLLPRALIQSTYYYDWIKHGNDTYTGRGHPSLLPQWEHELGSRW